MALMKILKMVVWIIARIVLVHGWSKGNATYYYGSEASRIMGDACGYGNLNKNGYGTNTAALSGAVFSKGAAICGACYEIMCDIKNDPLSCLHGKSITITATNYCPPNIDHGGWCNPPLQHFLMAQPAFLQIAKDRRGIVPVVYKRVPCKRKGGIRFTLYGHDGHDNFLQVLISNVGGKGEILRTWIRGSRTKWEQMDSFWGATWQMNSHLKGQRLSFSLMSSDGKVLTMNNVIHSKWRFGQTFTTSRNFK